MPVATPYDLWKTTEPGVDDLTADQEDEAEERRMSSGFEAKMKAGPEFDKGLQAAVDEYLELRDGEPEEEHQRPASFYLNP